MEGSQMTDDEALKFMRNKRLNVEFCLVRDWIWIDAYFGERDRSFR